MAYGLNGQDLNGQGSGGRAGAAPARLYAPRGMPLVARIALGVAAVLALCIGAGTGLIHHIVTDRFAGIETDLVLRNRVVVRQAVDSEVEFLRITVNDWSHWDDLHAYAGGRNPAFADSELGPRGVQRLSLDALLVLDPAGGVIKADFPPAVLAAAGGSDGAITRIRAALRKLHPGGNGDLPTVPVSGLLDTPIGTLALAAQPVTRTDGTGAVTGVLVMARRLEPQRLSRELSVLPADVRLFTNANIPPDLHQLAMDLGRRGETARLVTHGEDLADYQFFRDITGEPAFLLESRASRSIAAASRQATRLIAWISLAGTVLVLGTLIFVLRQLVTQPVARLTRHILSLRTGDAGRTVPGIDQGDEIGTLAQEFDALVRARRTDEATLQRLAAAVEHAGDAIAILNPTGHITYVNPQYERQTGCAAAEVLGRGPGRGRSAPEVHDGLWSAVGRGEEWHGLLQSTRRDGSPLEEEVTVAPIRGTDGEITGYVAVMRDVTAARRAQEELSKLAAAVEHAADAIVVMDARGRIEYCNPAYERQRGLPAARLLGRHPADLGRGLDSPEHYAMIWQAVQRGEIWRGEINTGCREQQRLVEEVVMSPIRGKDGRVSHYVGVLHDVTGRRQLEAELAQARRLEAIGQLAAGVAHEINTPIQYVGDNIRFLKDSFGSLAELLDALEAVANRPGNATITAGELARTLAGAEAAYLREEVPAAIAQSLEGVERVAEIVRSMKELAHPARDLVAADLNRVVRSAVTVASPEWRSVAELDLDLASDLEAVPCLPGSISQVVVNILVNAAHAVAASRARGGDPGFIRVSTRQREGWAEIEVADNGTGMEAGVRERLFEPFFTTKPVGQGTGQGLAIAHAVVKKHGGEIQVASEPGRGAVFTVRLPLTAAAGSRIAA